MKSRNHKNKDKFRKEPIDPNVTITASILNSLVYYL